MGYSPPQEDSVELTGVLAEFREALQDELEAARRASSSSAVQLISGRRIAQVGSAYQYLFLVESALNLPDDSPGDLEVPGRGRFDATVISVDGLAVTLSVSADLGSFVPHAALKSDLTHLLKKLIQRIEGLKDATNPAGSRLLGEVEPSGEPAKDIEPREMNREQAAAIASSIGRDATFIWGPPGTGKTRTIGRIGAELVRRNRSVLVVSHTNAAVDQAILKIADDLSDELFDGSIIRLGDPADPALLERPELLASTQIEKRASELAEEKASLETELNEKTARSKEVQRLLAIWDWLLAAEDDLVDSRQRLLGVQGLDEKRDEVASTLADLEEQGKTCIPRGEAAKQALEDEARVREAKAELERDEPALPIAISTESEASDQAEQARELLELCRQHSENVGSARTTLIEVGEKLERSRAALEQGGQDLERFESELKEADGLLARAVETSGLLRRWRGLPEPEAQQALVDEARRLCGEAKAGLDELRGAIAELERQQVEASDLISEWGHLPPLDEQESLSQRLDAEAEAAATQREGLSERVVASQSVISDLGDPRGSFEAEHRLPPEDADTMATLHQQLLEAAREQFQSAQMGALEARSALEDELLQRLVVLRDWGLSAGKATCAEEAVEEIESAFATAKEVVEGTSAGALRSEFNELNNRIRAIEQRLQEIEEELKEVENLVIAEAKVVATTLTRAYKRESVQKRRFDTVILDEASMAPIPALWVAAALADANVVVVGDFRQLPPIVQAETDVAKKWLGSDIFEKSGVQEAYEAHAAPPFFVALQEQFRMHPAISAIPNHFLYRDELRDADGLECDDGGMAEWFEADWGYDSPVLLVDTGSLNAWVTSVNNGRRASRLNFLSATVCVDLAAMLLRQGRPEQQGGRARVLIGAPYRPHAKLLSLLIRENKLDRDVRAGTTHTFQGSEAPVMIFDLVNDEPHWKVGMFMASRSEDFKRLLNVALTRAQRRLILVGDFDYIARQGKKAFVRELIDFMRERYPQVEAGAIIPSGLSARAARMQLAVQASAGPDALPHLVVTQDAFYSHLFRDLAAAEKRIVIYSAFLTQDRLGAVQPQLKAAVERGVSVWVVTKELEDRGKQRPHYKRLEEALREWGVQIAHKSRMHEKLVFVDEDVVWHGSLNALSFTDTQEIMARYDNRAVAEYFAKTVCMEELLEAYSNGLAGEGKCPFCLAGEVIAAEGKGEPFYWRCVNDDCFKRGIGDPMPKDGMVVCASSGCGAPVHFGSWGDEPHWRCDKNPHHRMKIAASHLRLPKMRDLIPARELKKLEKKMEEARAKRGQARPGRGSERAGQLPLL